MAYSNTSRKGREFLQYLTDLSVHATLFAPNDSGLKENEVRVFYFFPSLFWHFFTAIMGFSIPLKFKLRKIILVWCDFCTTPYNLDCAHKSTKCLKNTLIHFFNFPSMVRGARLLSVQVTTETFPSGILVTLLWRSLAEMKSVLAH